MCREEDLLRRVLGFDPVAEQQAAEADTIPAVLGEEIADEGAGRREVAAAGRGEDLRRRYVVASASTVVVVLVSVVVLVLVSVVVLVLVSVVVLVLSRRRVVLVLVVGLVLLTGRRDSSPAARFTVSVTVWPTSVGGNVSPLGSLNSISWPFTVRTITPVLGLDRRLDLDGADGASARHRGESELAGGCDRCRRVDDSSRRGMAATGQS